MNTIIYTKTDEAPALATYAFLPIIQAFTKFADTQMVLKDISLAGRIIAQFPEYLTAGQQKEDVLSELGSLVNDVHANIIKLPNISASVPQLKEAIRELNAVGYNLPDFPEVATTKEEESIRSRYARVLGSAVNPVLRQGNSDRRVAKAVKEYAKANPHFMGEWHKDSKSHVAHMQANDFYGSEQSYISPKDQIVKIELFTDKGVTTLKQNIQLNTADVIDASVMDVAALNAFFLEEIADAKLKDLLFSLHLKATMMKVSDPVIFGHCVQTFFKDVFEQHAETFKKLDINPNNGLSEIFSKIDSLSSNEKAEVLKTIEKVYQNNPHLAMVNSDKGITNLHVPSDVIIDASMPAAIRSSGKMWNSEGKLQDTKFVIPDRCYAGVYKEVIDFCKTNGAFDPKTMGSVANVGLMANKAEEYGSHDKTFIIPQAGTVKVLDEVGEIIFSHKVSKGDIWRMCQTKDAAIRDWVKLAITRAKLSDTPAFFWLNEERAHDKNLISLVEKYLKEHNTEGLEIEILSPEAACGKTCEIIQKGNSVISVTGNVLRDYLTDLFPILELGTSAKMLSIVPLLEGGGLFETGAGGSAPKHVEQFLEENHLRWDSLGEFLALAVSLEDLARKNNNAKAQVLANALNQANTEFLQNNKSPSRKVGEIDNRGSQFYLCLYWAKAVAEQNEDADLKQIFKDFYNNLKDNETTIMQELNQAQGKKIDIGGYYLPDDALAQSAMRSSDTLNRLLSDLN